MNEGHAGFPRRRAHPRADRRRPGLRHRADGGALVDRVHHPHPGARGHRPVPGGDGQALLRRPARRPVRCGLAAAARRSAGPDHRVRRGGRPVEVQHGAHGPAAGAARQRGVAAARPGQPRTCSTSCGRGSTPNEVPIGSITNGVHGPTWAAPQWLELGRELLGSEDLGSLTEPDTWQRLHQVDPGHMWWIRSQLRQAARRGRPGPAAPLVAGTWRLRCRIGLDRNGFRSGRVDHRVRPAGADLQAADADAARPGAAGEAAARREAADPADRGRQVASRRRRRQGADPAGGAGSPTGRRCGIASRSCPTTTCRWPG